MVPVAWSLSFAFWRSFVLIVGVPCLLCSLAVPGVWSFLRVTQLYKAVGYQSPLRVRYSVVRFLACFGIPAASLVQQIFTSELESLNKSHWS